jgi:hypothetical protein
LILIGDYIADTVGKMDSAIRIAGTQIARNARTKRLSVMLIPFLTVWHKGYFLWGEITG